MGLDGSLRAAGLVTSLAPMTIVTSVRREVVVDVVHLLHGVVLDIGLGQQHVHVPGHAARHRVDGVLHRDTLALFEHASAQVLDGVLGLRDGQTVAGHDDDLVGVGHLDRGIGRRRRPRTALSPSSALDGSDPAAAEAARRRSRGWSRFIALAIRLVRIEPDAPTIMPATIIAVLLSAKPAAAADNPVSALSSEMTTGMSAPPIGSTTIRPSTPAAISRPTIHHSDAPPLPGAPSPIATAAATAPTSSTRLRRLLQGLAEYRSGWPGRISCSLPNAMIEPQNEIEPMIAANSEADHDVHRRRLTVLEVREARRVNRIPTQRDQRDRAAAARR